MERATTITVDRWESRFASMSIDDQIRGREYWKTLHIHSPLLINALRAVVDYYPGNNMLGEPLVFPEPFYLLAWYWKELGAYQENPTRAKPHDIEVVAVVKDGMTVVESSSQKNWAGDFVEGEGEGQIILLHGPPGAGKTCTAGSSGRAGRGVIPYLNVNVIFSVDVYHSKQISQAPGKS
ncbi:hypothetical protein NHQ30_002488 [Ciborinia camelliae]|nr:hypothetical protein NHQ30_002488 [Ciborinia camelliae]